MILEIPYMSWKLKELNTRVVLKLIIVCFFKKKNLSQDVVSFFFGVGGGGGEGGEMVVSLGSQNVFGSDSTNYEDLDGK